MSRLDALSNFFDDGELATMTPLESMFPIFGKLVGSPSQARGLISFLSHETSDIRQIIIFALAGYAIPFLGNFIADGLFKMDEGQYKNTSVYHVINHISQGFKLASVVTFIESAAELALGFETEVTKITTHTLASMLFSIWGMYRVKVIKNQVVKYLCWRNNVQSKRVRRLWERVSDYLIYLTTTVTVLDQLGFKYRSAIKSISLFGGIGTILFSLASKDMAVELLSGLAISVTQGFEVGDEIQLQTGELGIVENVGPLHTYLRGEFVLAIGIIC